MPCYHPVAGFLKAGGGFTTNKKLSLGATPLTVPCGRCIGCKLEYSRQWAVRCMHEKRMHAESAFITLTYSDDHCPPDMSLSVDVHQRFMKRLRKAHGRGVKFCLAGEYGEVCRDCRKSRKYCFCEAFQAVPGRPHYHALLFGLDFDDKRLFKTVNGRPLYTSKKLEKLWPYGFSSVADVTFDSCCYVARYITKKITGDRSRDHYLWTDTETGEVFERHPEYMVSSRGGKDGPGGLGLTWFRKYGHEVFPADSVVVNGFETTVPRYYLKQFQSADEKGAQRLKWRRKRNGFRKAWDRTPDRLKVREECARARVNLKRGTKLNDD